VSRALTIKQYIKRLGVAFERTTLENTLLRKELTKARELLRIRKERKKGKYVVVKGKFVFDTKEILELVKEAEAEALKGKSKKRRTIKAITPEIKDEEEEYIDEDIYESEGDYIIVASSRSNPRKRG
jgi:RPA family protein